MRLWTLIGYLILLNNYYGCTEMSQEAPERANDLAVEFREEHVFEKYLDIPAKTW